MESILDYNTNPEHVDVDATILWCFDPRFVDVFNAFARRFERYDRIIVAGGAKGLVDPDSSEATYLLRQVEMSIELHSPKEIILTVHKNCGAYAPLSLDENETEEDFLASELSKARKTLEEKVGTGVAIRTLIVDFEGVHEVKAGEV